MRFAIFFASLLPSLQRRQIHDTGQYTEAGQYTQVVHTTWSSWSESYYLSWASTEVITLTSTIPCEVSTSYTTTYVCSECQPCYDCGATTCYPKSCSAGQDQVGEATYEPDEYVTALVTNGGAVATTIVPPSQCTAYAAFVNDGNPEGLEACPGTDDIVCVACIASPCLSETITVMASSCVSAYVASFTSVITSLSFLTTVITHTTTLTYSCDQTITTTGIGITPYDNGQIALVTANPPQPLSSPSFCSTYTSPADGEFGIEAVATCGPSTGFDVPCGGSEDNDGTCGVSTVTYTYASDGANMVVATTIDQHCGPFALNGGTSRPGAPLETLLFWFWAIATLLSGAGMIVL